MDSPRPLLSAELEFFNKGTGNGKPVDYLILCSSWYFAAYNPIYSQVIPYL